MLKKKKPTLDPPADAVRRVRGQQHPELGCEAWACIVIEGGGAEWKSRQNDVREEVVVEEEKDGGSCCHPVGFQSSSHKLWCLLLKRLSRTIKGLGGPKFFTSAGFKRIIQAGVDNHRGANHARG